MSNLPSPEAVYSYIEDFVARGDGHPTRRDITKAFGLKGPDRAALRQMLSDMESSGVITLDGKRARAKNNQLPPVMVMDAVAIDEDGDLRCEAVTAPDGVEVPPILLTNRAAAQTKPPIGVGSRFLGRLKGEHDGHLVVVPIKVLGKGANRVLGIFKKDRKGGRIEPVSRKQRDTYHVDAADVAGASDGDLVWAETKNKRGYGPRPARIVEVVGDVGASKNWSLVALAENDIPVDFPADVVAEADASSMPDDDCYEDLRSLPLITIDPASAKDHDDAVYAVFDESGFTVHVAIADVSWFVRPGTALDAEARKRGNSVYLVDRVVPMLPEVLSNGLCSLNAKVDRPAMVCEMRFNLDGQKTSHTFRRGIINCVAGISYEQAQAAVDGQASDAVAPITDDIIKPLFEAYRRMAEAKASKPSLDLDLPERQINLGQDGQVASVGLKDRFDAHKVIETMMVAANVCAAETLEGAKRTLIYRVHDAPNEERLEALRQYLESQKYSLPKGQVITPLSFNRVLAKAADREEMDLVSMAILRAQSQAVYDTKNVGHFGLYLQKYAHFTSPIRRYADLTVHRGLVAALKLGPGGNTSKDEDELEGIAEAISLTERRAISAERSTSDRFLAAYLAPQIGATFPGRISGVTSSGLFVALDETGADGYVPMRSLSGDYFVFDENAQALVGRHTGTTYRLGMRVEAVLLEVTPIQGGLRFEIVTEPGNKGKRGPSKPKSAKRPGRARPTSAGAHQNKPKSSKKRTKPGKDPRPDGRSAANKGKSPTPKGDGKTFKRKPRKSKSSDK